TRQRPAQNVGLPVILPVKMPVIMPVKLPGRGFGLKGLLTLATIIGPIAEKEAEDEIPFTPAGQARHIGHYGRRAHYRRCCTCPDTGDGGQRLGGSREL